MRPAMILLRDDLPAPFSPTRPCTDPGETARVMSVRMRGPPKLLLTPRSSTCGCGESGKGAAVIDLSGPFRRELVGDGLVDDAVVRVVLRRVDRAGVLTGAQRLDERLHSESTLGGWAHGDGGVPVARGDTLHTDGAGAVADQEHAALVRGSEGLDSTLDALIRAGDQV